MNGDKSELSDKYSAKSIGLLKRYSIPAYPKFYELFYTYASGTHIELNHKINEKISSGENPDIQFLDGLYSEFISSNGTEDRLSEVTDEILDSISKVNLSIDKARSNADNYSEMLGSAVGDLNANSDQEAVAKLTMKLLEKTKEMQVANNLLENELASAKGDISSLKDEVDAVRKESLLDPLTKIDNRKSFDRFLSQEISKAEESGEPLSLVMIDIDYFKKFNDQWGHQTGDQVLRLVGSTLRADTRDTDLAARYGGEEFALILPGANIDQAKMIAEKVRKSIKGRKLYKRSTNENLGCITVSSGVATFRSEDNIESLVDRADRCLYAAKRAGRNKVVGEDSPEMQNNAKVA